MSPSAEIAAVLFSLLFSFVLTLYVISAVGIQKTRTDQIDSVVTVSCSHSHNSGGGNGCTAFRHIPISSRASLARRLVGKRCLAHPSNLSRSNLLRGRLARITCRRTLPAPADTSKTQMRQMRAISVACARRISSSRRRSTFSTRTIGVISGL